MICGKISQIKKSIKILMHDGQRKMKRNFTAIKIMQRLIPRVNLLKSIQLQMLRCMIHRL